MRVNYQSTQSRNNYTFSDNKYLFTNCNRLFTESSAKELSYYATNMHVTLLIKLMNELNPSARSHKINPKINIY